MRGGLIIVFVAVPIFVADGGDESRRVNREGLDVAFTDFNAEAREVVSPTFILRHEIQNGKGKISVGHTIGVEVTEGVIEVLHVIKPFSNAHVRLTTVSHDLSLNSGGTQGVSRLIHRTQAVPGLLRICNAFDEMKLVTGDSGDNSGESCVVACHPGLGVEDGLLMFGEITRDMNSSKYAIVVKAGVSDSLAKGGNNRRHRVGSFNILPEVPITKFMIRLCSPFTVIIIGAIVCDFWKFRTMYGVVVGHNRG
jgi:hypothetical protein